VLNRFGERTGSFTLAAPVIARDCDWVTVGMPVTRHPPYRSVLALLTHTVLTSDEFPYLGMLERKANFWVRMQRLDVR